MCSDGIRADIDSDTVPPILHFLCLFHGQHLHINTQHSPFQRICRFHADYMFYFVICFFSDIVHGFGHTVYDGHIYMEKESGADHIFCPAGPGGSHVAEAVGV